MTGFYMHGQISLSAECLVANATSICSIRMPFLLMDLEIIFCCKLHTTSLAHKLSIIGFMAFFDVSSESESRIEHFFAEITLEVDIKLPMDLVLVLDTAVHVPEGLLAHVARQSGPEAVTLVVVGHRLVVFLELGLAEQAVMHGHLVRAAQPHRAVRMNVVGVQFSLLQFDLTRVVRNVGLSSDELGFLPGT